MVTVEARRRRVRRTWRCAECGHALLEVYGSGIPKCERHPEASLVQWTSQMAAAYRVQLERHERGEQELGQPHRHRE